MRKTQDNAAAACRRRKSALLACNGYPITAQQWEENKRVEGRGVTASYEISFPMVRSIIDIRTEVVGTKMDDSPLVSCKIVTVTMGRGVRKCQNFTDIICGCSLKGATGERTPSVPSSSSLSLPRADGGRTGLRLNYLAAVGSVCPICCLLLSPSFLPCRFPPPPLLRASSARPQTAIRFLSRRKLEFGNSNGIYFHLSVWRREFQAEVIKSAVRYILTLQRMLDQRHNG